MLFRFQRLPFAMLAACLLVAAATTAQDDSSRVAFAADGGIYTANVDGTERELLLATDATPNSVAWSPDGTRIAYVMLNGDNQHDIFVYDVEREESALVVDSAAEDLLPAWSPDGEQLAYASSEAGNYDIWTVDLDCIDTSEGCGAARQNLTNSEADDRAPWWSPDGEQIAFVSSGGADDDRVHFVYTMNADGSNVQRVTNEADQDASAVAWSPDGTQLLYRNGGVNDIGSVELIDTEGNNRQVLARGDIGYTLAWSPAGEQIVYGCWFGRRYQMCVIDADCGGTIEACVRTREIYDFGRASLFSWQPAGE